MIEHAVQRQVGTEAVLRPIAVTAVCRRRIQRAVGGPVVETEVGKLRLQRRHRLRRTLRRRPSPWLPASTAISALPRLALRLGRLRRLCCGGLRRRLAAFSSMVRAATSGTFGRWL